MFMSGMFGVYCKDQSQWTNSRLGDRYLSSGQTSALPLVNLT
jgi:hypothetical protein